MQSKNKYPSFYPKQKSVSLSLTVIMVFRENFSSSVHPSEIRLNLQDTHHIFSFVPSHPFPDSRDTTRSGTTISLLLLLLQAIFISRTPGSPESFCSSPFCFSSNRKSSHFPQWKSMHTCTGQSRPIKATWLTNRNRTTCM